MTRDWKQGLLAMPGIGIALLPKLFCPLCWPLYAGVVSSIGLGFLVGTTYLLPITSTFLVITLAVLGFRAKQRHGYGPLVVGVFASAAVLIGKFYLESNSIMYSGVGLLVIASLWNAWPRREETAVCLTTPDTVQISGAHQGRP
jgi:mercuric ion transport protein